MEEPLQRKSRGKWGSEKPKLCSEDTKLGKKNLDQRTKAKIVKNKDQKTKRNKTKTKLKKSYVRLIRSKRSVGSHRERWIIYWC